MHPTLFEISIPFLHWTLPIFGFGATLAAAILSANWLAGRCARRDRLDVDRVARLMIWMLVAGIAGSRMFYIVEHPRQITSFAELFKVWEGGLVFYGGVMAAAVVFWAYTWLHELPRTRTLDVLAPPIALAIGIGRVGCLLNGCCWGQPTHMPWGIRFPAHSLPWNDQVLHHAVDITSAQTLPVHPTQLYLSMAGFALLACTTLVSKRRHWNGQVFAVLAIGYGVTRFVIEFFRGDVPRLGDGLTISQNISLILLAVCAGLWVYLRWPELNDLVRNSGAGDVLNDQLPSATGAHGLQ